MGIGEAGGGEGPICPFCSSPWTAEMLALLDLHTMPCGCGGGDHAHHAAPEARPSEDICCARCNRAIFRAVALPMEMAK